MKKILSILVLVLFFSCKEERYKERLSDKLKQEQKEVNTWARAIVFKENEMKDAATNNAALEAVRKEFILRLDTKYPEFLKGMNTDTPLAAAIELRLEVYNQLSEQRIRAEEMKEK